jgi:hypothetical protein
MREASSQVPTAAAHIRPLLVGSLVPKLTLLTATGVSFDLSTALPEKPTILNFYRGSW